MKNLYFILSGIFTACLVSNTYAQSMRPERIQKVSLKEFSTGQPIVSGSDKLFFEIYEPAGNTIWLSDGTEDGTRLIKEINPVCKNCGAGFTEVYKDEYYFSHNDSLWKSDGTNTSFVAPGAGMRLPMFFTKSNGLLFFRAYNQGTGYELWKTDGTDAGTVMVRDINESEFSSSEPHNLIDVNNTLFFVAHDGSGYALWKSDGTNTGTVKVKDVLGWNQFAPKDFINVNGILYFQAYEENTGYELWKSDGTTRGTVLVKDLKPGEESSFVRELIHINGTLYFIANASAGAEGELWKSDGTAAGTVMIKDLYADEMMNLKLLNANGELLIASNWIDKWHLSKLNAATSEIIKLKEVNKNPSIVNFVNPTELISHKGVAYFAATDSVKGYEVWKSDGTASGTYTISDYKTDQPIYGFTEAHNKLYFYVNDSSVSLSLNTLVETVSFDEPQPKKSAIKFYPNPATNQINTSFSENKNVALQIELYDISGRKVFNKSNIMNNETIDLNTLPNGLYIFIAKSGNEILQREKLVIQK